MKGRSSDRSVKLWRQQDIKGHCPFWQAISLRQRISGLFVPGCWVGCGCSRCTRTASGFERNWGQATSSRRSRLVCFVVYHSGFLWTNLPELLRDQIERPLADCSGARLNFVIFLRFVLIFMAFVHCVVLSGLSWSSTIPRSQWEFKASWLN